MASCPLCHPQASSACFHGETKQEGISILKPENVECRERRLRPRWESRQMSVPMSQDLTAVQELPAPRQLPGARKENGLMLSWCFPEHPFGGTQVQLLGVSCLPASILASVNS